MSNLNIRLKTKDGNVILNDSVTPDSTVGDLKNAISDTTGVSKVNLKILHGYPPKVLGSPDTETLAVCGLKSGDTLVIETENYNQQDVTTVQENAHSPMDEDSNNLGGTPHVTEDDIHSKGIIMKREVPSDNSCLFTSIGFVISGNIDVTIGGFLRQLVAETIKNKPEIYNDGILGKNAVEYCEWILNPNSWGGAIELAVLSEHYGFEVVVANTTTGILNRFGEDKSYSTRAFLIFDGIHYDPLYMEFSGINEPIQTLFPTTNNDVLLEVEQLMMEAKSSKQYTDLYRFSLTCTDCGTLLIGQNDAQQHAMDSGHTNFVETNT